MSDITYIAPVDIGPSDLTPTGPSGDGTPVIIHDHLCPCTKHHHYGETDYLRSTCVYCRCELIALVRADTGS